MPAPSIPPRAITLTIAEAALLSIARARGQSLVIPKRHWHTIGVATFFLLAVALGGAAVALLMVPSFAAYSDAPLGLAARLLSGIGWAIGTLILQRSDVEEPATVLTDWQLLATAVPITAGALVLDDHQWFVPSWTSIAVFA
jgi:hypothetical protein